MYMMLVPRRDIDLFDDFFNDPFFKGGERHSHPLMKTDIKETEAVLEEKKKLVEAMQKERDEKNILFQEQSKTKKMLERKNQVVEELNQLYHKRGEISEKIALCDKQKRAQAVATELKKVDSLSEETKELKEQVAEMLRIINK